MSSKRVGKAIAGGQRASDPPHFFAEQHVIVVRPDAIGMRQGEVKHPHGQSCPENQPRRTDFLSGLVESHIHWVVFYSAESRRRDERSPARPGLSPAAGTAILVVREFV